MRIDRRTMLAGSAAAGVLAASPGLALAGEAAPVLFIFDARFISSRTTATLYAAAGSRIIDPRELDLGIAWRGEIAALLADGPRVIAGTTLWSDRFICETFGREHGLVMRDDPGATALEDEGKGLLRWVLS